MDEAAEFGLKDGLCVPIHLPLAGPAVVTAASDRIEIPPDALPLIETLCVHAFRKLSGLQTKRGEGETTPLTPRERGSPSGAPKANRLRIFPVSSG